MFDLQYKKHIQFLRAFSVISVFLYHTNISLFSKGYLGVDIFFVISGFVITQRIFQNYEIEKKINLKQFYINRFKRIIPNLIFIVCITYILFVLFGPPDIHIWDQTLSSIFGVSNIYYLTNKIGYFNNIFDDPLGHTWSLGVEEQFYLLYPFLIFLVFFFKNNKFLKLQIVFLTIFFVSLFIFKTTLETNPLVAFYLSPLRFWELIFGAILFLNYKKFKKNNLISIGAFLLILYYIFSHKSYNYFYLNLTVVFLSGVFVLFFNKSNIIESNKLVYFGNISYSFYLWHLPVLFFFDLYILSEFYLNFIISFIITVLLSVMSYHLIEQKFRYLKFKKIHYYFVFTGILALTFLIYVKYFNNDLKKEIKNFVKNSNYLNLKYDWNKRMSFKDSILLSGNKIYDHCMEDSKNYKKNSYDLLPKCLKQKNYKTLFFIEGNSHTAQYIPMFDELNSIENIYFKHTKNYKISVKMVNELNKKFNEIIYITNIDNIKKFNEVLLNHAKFNQNIKFILFKTTPYPKNKSQPSKCLIQQINCVVDKYEDYKKRNLNTLFEQIENLVLKNNNIFLFDSYEHLCPRRKCTIYNKKKDKLFFRDATHLSIEGSESLLVNFKKFIQNLKNQNLIYNY